MGCLLVLVLLVVGGWASLRVLFPCPSVARHGSPPNLEPLDALCLNIGDGFRVVNDPATLNQFGERLFSRAAREDPTHAHCVICGQTGNVSGHRADGSVALYLYYAARARRGGLWGGFPAGVQADGRSQCYPLSRETVRWLHEVAAARSKLWGWSGQAPSDVGLREIEARLSAAGFEPVRVFWYSEEPASSGESGGQSQQSATRGVLVLFEKRPEHENDLESAVLGTVD